MLKTSEWADAAQSSGSQGTDTERHMRNKVYTCKNTPFAEWFDISKEKLDREYPGVPMPPALGIKHCYELGYTPDSWVREVSDMHKRRQRRMANAKAE